MTEHIIVKPVFGKNVGCEVAVVVQPVVCEFLGAEHQNRTIAQFVIFDYRERGEGFPQANTIRQNSAVECFELVVNAVGRVALEIEQLLPDQAVLIAGSIIGQVVLVKV